MHSKCTEDSTKENKCSTARCGKISESETLQCPSGQCCNSEGYCGTSENYCYSSKGCQPLYGICQCGETDNAGTCSNDYCCSKKGYCGLTSDFCSTNNCQTGFGQCDQNNYTCEDVKSNLVANKNNDEIVDCEENENGYVSELTIKNKKLSDDDLKYIYTLKTLKSLTLKNNELESIPEGINGLINMNQLSITDNKLEDTK